MFPIDINQSIDTDNGWPIDCKDLCGYRMVLIGFPIIHFHWLEMPRQVGNSSTRAMEYILCIEKTGLELCQSMNCFCGYRLIIDWLIPTDTNWYQLTHFIHWYQLINWFSDHRFRSIGNNKKISFISSSFFCWHY